MVGWMDDIRTEPLDQAVNRHLQPASPRGRSEQRELGMGVDRDQVVGDQANQAKRTGMGERVEKIDADRVKLVGNVGRLMQTPLPCDDGKLRGLELHADA